MPTYRNTSDHELTIVGVGNIAAGATFDSLTEVENDNVARVTSVIGTESPQPAVISDATVAENQTITGDN